MAQRWWRHTPDRQRSIHVLVIGVLTVDIEPFWQAVDSWRPSEHAPNVSLATEVDGENRSGDVGVKKT
jgi:hypothetical protein